MDRAGLEAIDEVAAQLVLYGPQTRSGEIHLTPLRPCEHGNAAGLCHEEGCSAGVYRAAHDPRGFQPWVEEWIDWGSVVWFPVGRSISLNVFGHSDPVVITINGRPIRRSQLIQDLT